VLAAAVERDVLEALRLAEHGADRDHQNVEQPVLDLPLAARVLDRLERSDQGFQHGLPPSGKAEPLARIIHEAAIRAHGILPDQIVSKTV
jgi:hypothetical protein